MIANAWYTINYFHISFGKQDLIQTAAATILATETTTIDIKKAELLAMLLQSNKKPTIQALGHFNKTVPHWYLTPWFPKAKLETDAMQRKRIYTASQHFENDCPYALHDNEIVINPKWVPYFIQNAKILKDFCYWNLALFLQTRNPNVPDIPNKLIKPIFRGTLSRQRK